MADNVEVIEKLWSAFERGDVDKASALIAETGEIVASPKLPWGGTFIGPEGFKDLASGLNAAFKDYKARPLKVLGSDDNHVTVLALTTARTKSGRPLEVEVVWLYQLRDGRITAAHAFTDTAAILEALG